MLAVLLALSESPSPEPPPTPTPEAEIQHQVGNEEKGESTPVAKPVVAPTRSGEEAEPSRDNRDNKSSPDRGFNWELLFTGVIAFGAAAQVFAVIYQGRITRRQLRATQQSADAATQAVTSTKVFNRARIVIEDLVFHDVDDTTKTAFHYEYKLRNKGKTTAYVFECLDAPCILEELLPGPPQYQGEPTARNYTLGLEQAVVFASKSFEKSQFDMSKLTNGKGNIYALGFIRYRDDFGSEWLARYGRQHRPGAFKAPIIAIAGYDDTTTAS